MIKRIVPHNEKQWKKKYEEQISVVTVRCEAGTSFSACSWLKRSIHSPTILNCSCTTLRRTRDRKRSVARGLTSRSVLIGCCPATSSSRTCSQVRSSSSGAFRENRRAGGLGRERWIGMRGEVSLVNSSEIWEDRYERGGKSSQQQWEIWEER